MKIRCKILLILFIMFNLVKTGLPETMEFLNIPIGARPIGLGEAYSSIADDVNAINYNPAGLGNIQSRQIEFTHGNWINLLNYENLSYCNPFLGGNIGINIFCLYSSPFWETDFSGPVNNKIDYNNIGITLGYGKYIYGFNIGGSVAYIYSDLADSCAKALLMSFGLQHKRKVVHLPVSFSFVLKNIGPAIKYEKEKEKPPSKIIGGIGISPINVKNHKLQLGFDYEQLIYKDTQYRLLSGVEYVMFNIISFRGGYRFNADINKISVGTGIKCYGIGINYALYPASEPDYTHIISININFNKFLK